MKVVVIGSGIAGTTVALGLAVNSNFNVTLVTKDKEGYYARPRLSHGISAPTQLLNSIVLKRFNDFPPEVNLLTGVEVVRVDRLRRELELETGATIEYEVLVMATGSAARIPPEFAHDTTPFFTLNTLEDLHQIRTVFEKSSKDGQPSWAIVGGGLIGCELASDLSTMGAKVSIFERSGKLVGAQLTEDQSQRLLEHLGTLGIAVHFNQKLEKLPNGYSGVVVCAGFAPRIALAGMSGLKCDTGIVVDDYLATNDSNIYCVGDAAQIGSKTYPFIMPARSQAQHLVDMLLSKEKKPWTPPQHSMSVKVHGFKLQSVK